ncbi:MAG: large-conductance mechanosensitive channel protein MscL [Vampirovibrionales bacterium]
MLKGLMEEFKAFALKGNVVDLAVGIIIGGAFGKIVSSVVADVVMPPIGVLIGGVNFTNLKLVLKPEDVDAAGKTIEAVTLNYGNFLQVCFDFTIVAFAVFMLVKGMNHLKTMAEKPVAVDAPATEPAPPAPEVLLLQEIRDLLKK